MDGSVACAARCLASSALRRQVSLSDDIRGGSSNAPNQASSAALVSWSTRRAAALWQVRARRSHRERIASLLEEFRVGAEILRVWLSGNESARSFVRRAYPPCQRHRDAGVALARARTPP